MTITKRTKPDSLISSFDNIWMSVFSLIFGGGLGDLYENDFGPVFYRKFV